MIQLIIFFERVADRFADGIPVAEFGQKPGFNFVPKSVNVVTCNDFFLLCKIFVGINNPFNTLEPGNIIAGNDRIKVDGANTINSLKQQVKKQPDIVLGVKLLSPLKNAIDPVLVVIPFHQWRRILFIPANQCYLVAGTGK